MTDAYLVRTNKDTKYTKDTKDTKETDPLEELKAYLDLVRQKKELDSLINYIHDKVHSL